MPAAIASALAWRAGSFGTDRLQRGHVLDEHRRRDDADLEVHLRVVRAAQLGAAADEAAGRVAVISNWLSREVRLSVPYGMTSRLNRNSGTQNEWMTSSECSMIWTVSPDRDHQDRDLGRSRPWTGSSGPLGRSGLAVDSVYGLDVRVGRRRRRGRRGTRTASST